MRTTLDLPDGLFRKAKLQAVHEGIALKEVVTRALERGLELVLFDSPAYREHAQRRRQDGLDG